MELLCPPFRPKGDELAVNEPPPDGCVPLTPQAVTAAYADFVCPENVEKAAEATPGDADVVRLRTAPCMGAFASLPARQWCNGKRLLRVHTSQSCRPARSMARRSRRGTTRRSWPRRAREWPSAPPSPRSGCSQSAASSRARSRPSCRATATALTATPPRSVKRRSSRAAVLPSRRSSSACASGARRTATLKRCCCL